MAHGEYKGRRERVSDILRSKRGGTHEVQKGPQTKRARVNRAFDREVRSELRSYGR